MSELKNELAYHWWRLCHDFPDSESVWDMSQNLDVAYWSKYERAADHILLVIEVIGARLVTDLDRPHSLASTHKWFPPEGPKRKTKKAPAAKGRASDNKRAPWTAHDLGLASNMRKQGKSTKAIAKALGRSVHAINVALWKARNNHPIGPLQKINPKDGTKTP